MKRLCRLPADFHRYYRECSEPRVQRLRIKLRVFAVFIVLVASPFSSTTIPTQAPVSSNPHSAEKIYDVTSFGSELQRLEVELQTAPSPTGIKKFRDGLPQSWTVTTPEHSYSNSTKSLSDQVNGNSVDNADTWLEPR